MSHVERPRRFATRDVLVLIAGLAAGLALARSASPPDFTAGKLRDAFLNPRGGWTLWHAFGLTLELGTVFFVPFVAGWTPACLLLQLAPPRPPWRRLRRRPGFVACLVATAFVTATLSVAAALLATGMGSPPVVRPLLPRPRAGRVARGLRGRDRLVDHEAVWHLQACPRMARWTRPARLGAIWAAVGAICLCFAALAMA